MIANQIASTLQETVARVQDSVVAVVSSARGAGAGVVWRADGAILTNHHVVAGKGPLTVEFRDGRRLDAKVTNSNPSLDLALLEVSATGLPAALVDDSSALRVGELVFAIGHPWGMRDTVTMGIVSGTGTVRVGRSGAEATFIRSDVALAPGNSGGALFNVRGAVVGIPAMILGNDLAVAIPSAVAREWVAGLPSRRVSLGVEVFPVEVPVAWRPSAQAAGLMVTAVPRAPSALLVGDVLLDVAGEPVSDGDALSHALGRRGPRDRVRLRLLRGGTLRDLEVEAGELEQV